MVKKAIWVMLIAALSLVAAGCGPKKATKETLSQIEECKSAYEEAKVRKSDLEKELANLKAQLDEKQQTVETLKAERDSLNDWLTNVLEKGY